MGECRAGRSEVKLEVCCGGLGLGRAEPAADQTVGCTYQTANLDILGTSVKLLV